MVSLVTLHVSVWVEIAVEVTRCDHDLVTLHVSVWVEICTNSRWLQLSCRHAPRERVSWNLLCSTKMRTGLSHAPRERVSWNCYLFARICGPICHAPRERVSWNYPSKIYRRKGDVTLHVSVWVEIVTERTTAEYTAVTLHVSVWVEMVMTHLHMLKPWVTLHVSVWVEIPETIDEQVMNLSRSTWACELKFKRIVATLQLFSHAPRERVSWNIRIKLFKILKIVTLHVSVWVEMNQKKKIF